MSTQIAPEIWKPSLMAPGYECSSQGHIRSQTRLVTNRGRMYQKKGKIINQSEDDGGYLYVMINPQGLGAFKKLDGTAKTKKYYVHRMVIDAFKGPCPPDKYDTDGTYQVDHWDRNRHNNAPDNLFYKTRLENAANRVLNPLKGSDSPLSKISEQTASLIKRLGKEGYGAKYILNFIVDNPTTSGVKIEDVDKITVDIIKGIIKGKTWKHLE